MHLVKVCDPVLKQLYLSASFLSFRFLFWQNKKKLSQEILDADRLQTHLRHST